LSSALITFQSSPSQPMRRSLGFGMVIWNAETNYSGLYHF
jgi:hypothetical protein